MDSKSIMFCGRKFTITRDGEIYNSKGVKIDRMIKRPFNQKKIIAIKRKDKNIGKNLCIE